MKIIKNDQYLPSESDLFLLAGDIGGTNTNIALMVCRNNQFIKVLESETPTNSIIQFMDPLLETLETIYTYFPSIQIRSCCISAAGPIKENFCQLTNATWFVNGKLIEEKTGIKTRVINDFSALSHAIPLLDKSNNQSVIQLPSPNGELPLPLGNTMAVIGAGTGLGVGFIPWVNNKHVAIPSEGGHLDFPAFDDETTELVLYLRKKLGFHPGVERIVSGSGLSWIFRFLLEKRGFPTDSTIESILAASEDDKPYFISKNVESHNLCYDSHKLFRRIYGKIAGNYATLFLPAGGLFIAGGVISKDERHFLADSTFMEAFSINHKDNISELLKTIPVYIVRDYSTSLLGAAVAALEN